MRKKFVFSKEAGPICILSEYQKGTLFESKYGFILFFRESEDVVKTITNEEDRASCKKLTTSEMKVKLLRLQEHLGKQDFHYDATKLFEQITKAVTIRKEELFKT